ncbi:MULTISPECIES: substrate-binding periplasmic protein [Shewanella]|nr:MULTISPECIES: transporter substrate-binding domain-containing protein [Shewanella]
MVFIYDFLFMAMRLNHLVKALMALLLLLSLSTNAETLTIASSEGPPHTINDIHHGIDLDIVEAVLMRLGYDVDYQFMGLKRAQHELKMGHVDVTAPTFMQSDIEGSFTSAPIVQYQPMVFSLKSSKLTPISILDMQGHSVATFQGAPGYFGADFIELAKGKQYKEITDMAAIPELLAKARYDFAVLDKYIFYYFYRLNDKSRDVSIFTEHRLIPAVAASASFHDAAIRDAFNNELPEFLNSEECKQIFERYLGSALLSLEPNRQELRFN